MKESVCPICQKQVPSEPGRRTNYFPFCSRRCQMIDLGHWLKGNYTIAGRPLGRDEPQDEGPSDK